MEVRVYSKRPYLLCDAPQSKDLRVVVRGMRHIYIYIGIYGYTCVFICIIPEEGLGDLVEVRVCCRSPYSLCDAP